MAVPSIFPAIAVDLVGSADPTGCQHNGCCSEQPEPATLAIITERARDPLAILEQGDDGVFPVDLASLVDAMVLQRADHCQARAVAHVGKSRVAVAPKIPLQYPAITGAVEQRSPGFQLSYAVGRLLGV